MPIHRRLWWGKLSERCLRMAAQVARFPWHVLCCQWLGNRRWGSRIRRAGSQRWGLLDVLEERQLLAAISAYAVQDGFAVDNGADGTFDSLTLTGPIQVGTNSVGLMEFDFLPPVAGQTISNPTLNVVLNNVNSTSTIIDFYGYSSDGVVTLGDATQSGVLLGTVTTQYSSQFTIPLNVNTLNSLRGTTGKVGVRAVARAGQAAITNQETGWTNSARITYDAVNTAPQTNVLDFQRLSYTGSRLPNPVYMNGSLIYLEDGYQLSGSMTILGSNTIGNYVGSTTAGFQYTNEYGYNGITLRRADGAAFTLKSLDLAKFGVNDPEAYVLFTGNKPDGTIVQQAGWASHFQLKTEQFAGFDNVTSVTWNAPLRYFASDTSERFQIDNIVVESLGVNDPQSHAPVLTEQQFSVSEEAPVGTVVGQLAAVDPDGIGFISYGIYSSSVNGAFSISSSGQILVANPAAIDFTLTPSIDLVVVAQDFGREFDIASIHINVLDAVTGPYDRLTPTIDGTKVGTTVNSSAPVLRVNQTASSDGAQGLIEFPRGSITANEIQNASLEVFVDSNLPGGRLTVRGYVGDGVLAGDEAGTVDLWTGFVGKGWNVLPLSAEALRTLATGTHFGMALINSESTSAKADFQIRSQEHPSGAGPQLRILRYVNVAPVLNDITFTIPERAPTNQSNDPTVGTLLATDANPKDKLTYSLISSSTPGLLAVNSAGRITVADPARLDFETAPTITLTVQVTDSGSYPALSDTATVTIHLTNVNEAPVLGDASFTIPENSPAGTIVGTVPATPDPEGDAVTFSLQNDTDVFEINPTTGQIRVKAGANALFLDYELPRLSSIQVQVQDVRGATSAREYAIDLTNVAESPVFPAAVQTLTAGEFLPTGTALMTLQAFDSDVGSVLTYSITSVVGAPAGAVAVDPATGKLRVTDPTAFDLESRTQFTVNVQVTDNTSLTGTMAVVVKLTSTQDLTVPEYSTTVGTVRAPSSFGVDFSATRIASGMDNVTWIIDNSS